MGILNDGHDDLGDIEDDFENDNPRLHPRNSKNFGSETKASPRPKFTKDNRVTKEAVFDKGLGDTGDIRLDVSSCKVCFRVSCIGEVLYC